MSEAKPAREVTVAVNCENLDEAIKKANRLVELLREASNLIDSLSGIALSK